MICPVQLFPHGLVAFNSGASGQDCFFFLIQILSQISADTNIDQIKRRLRKPVNLTQKKNVGPVGIRQNDKNWASK